MMKRPPHQLVGAVSVRVVFTPLEEGILHSSNGAAAGSDAAVH